MIEIPNFTVERELGRGGMATVYLAVQDMLSRNVALKVMLPDMARDENFRKSFLSEGKIIANLEHPNIVRIHDFGIIDDSILYMAMEHLSEGTLKEKLAKGKLSYDAALKIIEDTSAGLQYAHAKGYIHRDIKPGNILFREDGTAVITDFGIAKLQDTSGELTRMGYTMGTVQYMSPEQAVTTDLDHRSDIYSLGLVFYEMLTGQKAFKAESTIQAIHQHTTVAPPQLPPEYSFLQVAIDKVLAKDPGDRFQNITDFVDSVRNAREVDSTIIHRIPPLIDDDSTQILRTGHYQVNPPPREKKSNKGKYFSIASILVLLSGLVFGVTKYPEINSWLNRDEFLLNQKVDLAKENLIVQQKKTGLLDQEKLKKEREAERVEQEKIKQDQLSAIEVSEKSKLEAEKQEKALAERIALTKKQQLLENEQKKTEAVQKEREELLAKQIADAKQQAAEAEIIKLKAKEKERERLLAAQIALAKKKESDAKRIELEAKQKERERVLIEQIAKAKKQAKAAQEQRIKAEQLLQERIKREQAELALIKKSQLEEDNRKAEQEKHNNVELLNAQKKNIEEKQEKEKIQLALAEKNSIESKKLDQEKQRAEQERLDAEIALLRKEKEEKLEKKRLAEKKQKDKINKEMKRKEELASKKAREAKKKKDIASKKAKEAKRKKDLARKKANQEKKRKAALIAKKKAAERRRQQQLANSRGQIRASATLNGRPLNTTFIITKNGKRVKVVGGRASAQFVLPAGQYVLSTSFSGKVSRANVNLEPNDIITQSFAFRGSAPVKQPKIAPKDWTHEHSAPKY